MIKTVTALVFAAAVLVSVQLAAAPLAGKVYRVGIVTTGFFTAAQKQILQQGLRDLGYIDGQNVFFEWRFAEGKLDRLRDLVTELIRLKVDVIVSNSTEAIKMVVDMNRAMPVVMASISDPLGSGLVASLARPGGSVTGLSMLSTELGGKRLELLKEAAPRVSRVALLVQRNSASTHLLVPEMEKAAKGLKMTVQSVEVATPNEIESAFASIIRTRANGLFVQNNNVFSPNPRPIAELAAKHRLPAIGAIRSFPDAGGLMSYAPDTATMWRRTVFYVDKILNGTKPADLPVEQPMKFELIINLKAAKQIGLTVPPNLLVRADKVIR